MFPSVLYLFLWMMDIMRRELLHKLKGYMNFLKESDFIVLDAGKRGTPFQDSSSVHEGEEKAKKLKSIARKIASCTKCRLSQERTHTVPGDGSPTAKLVFVGEAPGFHEDEQGLPFVGAAGKLLERLLTQISLSRKDVFICNVVKCRPPGNRDPLPDEISSCEPYLLEQLDTLKPLVICALGRYAAQTLLRTDEGINRLRGRFHVYHDIPLLPTLHPAAILRNASQIKDIEADFDLLKRKLKEISG